MSTDLLIEPFADETEDTEEVVDQPRQRPRIRQEVLLEVGVAVTAGLAGAMTFRALFNWGGLMSSAVWWYLITVAVMWVLSREREGAVVAGDRIVTVFVWSIGLLAVALLAWLLVFVGLKGIRLLSPSFFTQDLAETGALQEGGGVLHGIIGSLEQVGTATLLSVPVSILTAVYLHEIKGRFAPLVRFMVDSMSGLPSIVAGLLVFTTWVAWFGFSGFAASLALTILMIPTVTRTAEENLRVIPGHLREAGLALGAPRWRVVGLIVLPTARAGLLTATILGIARAVGETAPVILTAFGNSGTNTNLFKDPQASLPTVTWQLIRAGNQTQIDRAWGAAVVLVTLILLLFLSARIIAARSDRKLGRRR